MVLTDADRRLIAAIQGGLPLVSRPYAAIAERVGLSEDAVIRRIAEMKAQGSIKRLGIVVRHHELGYLANAMVVWDIPDQEVDALGEKMGALDRVTLCYQRPRRLPRWPYNLFCMIHGRSRDVVEQQVEKIAQDLQLEAIPHRILFSGRRFKQRGARYQ